MRPHRLDRTVHPSDPSYEGLPEGSEGGRRISVPKPMALAGDDSTGEKPGAECQVQRLAKRTGRLRHPSRPVIELGAEEVAQPMHQCQQVRRPLALVGGHLDELVVLEQVKR